MANIIHRFRPRASLSASFSYACAHYRYEDMAALGLAFPRCLVGPGHSSRDKVQGTGNDAEDKETFCSPFILHQIFLFLAETPSLHSALCPEHCQLGT